METLINLFDLQLVISNCIENLQKIEAGSCEIEQLSNGGTIKINFKKSFKIIPVVILGSTIGITSNGFSEGAQVSKVTKNYFEISFEWQITPAQTIYYVAIGL